MSSGERNETHTTESDPSSRLAAEMRRWSNLGHRVEGGLLAAVSILALLEAAGVLSGGWVYVWPGLLVAAGPSFVPNVYHHPDDYPLRNSVLLAEPSPLAGYPPSTPPRAT